MCLACNSPSLAVTFTHPECGQRASFWRLRAPMRKRNVPDIGPPAWSCQREVTMRRSCRYVRLRTEPKFRFNSGFPKLMRMPSSDKWQSSPEHISMIRSAVIVTDCLAQSWGSTPHIGCFTQSLGLRLVQQEYAAPTTRCAWSTGNVVERRLLHFAAI